MKNFGVLNEVYALEVALVDANEANSRSTNGQESNLFDDRP